MNPFQIIKEEHELLYDAIKTISLVQAISDNTRYHKLMNDLIIFIRNYTEIFHFPKEDKVLYPILQKFSQNEGQDFRDEIYDNHEDLKALIADMEKHFVYFNYDLLRKATTTYLAELKNHLKREDNIVLNKTSNMFSNKERELILDEFSKIDSKYDFDEKNNLIETFLKIKLQIN